MPFIFCAQFPKNKRKYIEKNMKEIKIILFCRTKMNLVTSMREKK